MANMLKLTIVGGEKNGKTMSFNCAMPVLVGRSRSADLRLSEPDVSGKHFEIVRDGEVCKVRVKSRNGLVVDGHTLQCGETAEIKAGSEIEVGITAKIRIDATSEVDAAADAPISSVAIDESGVKSDSSTKSDVIPSIDSASMGGASISEVGLSSLYDKPADMPVVAGFAADAEAAVTPKPVVASSDDAETAPDPVSGKQFPGSNDMVPLAPPPSGVAGFDDDGTAADDEDSLTRADGDGETQEMKTRIGSMEEIVERERQLERMTFRRRVRVGFLIGLFMLVLVAVWYLLSWSSHAVDVYGPYLPDGEKDVAETMLYGEDGSRLFLLMYPRYAGMKVTVSSDSNSVDVVTWFGTKKDVPFHLEFTRWNDRTDLMRSLEGSFERWMMDEAAKGSAFETHGGIRPEGEFFDNVFPDLCDGSTLRGMRFVRSEYTRSRNNELWHGYCLYFRDGDRIHLLRLEIPDMYWKIAKDVVMSKSDPHIGVYKAFLQNNWDSPGKSGLVDVKLSDDELISRIKHELSAERVGAWPVLASYIDTLLVRSWGDKPRIQKEALAFYRQMQKNMERYYHEREFAYVTASKNGDEKLMRSIFADCQNVFGALTRDRRSTLVNNPEEWSCRPRR